MGTHCFINIYQTLESQDDGSEDTCDHICTIMRTADGRQAYELALDFCAHNTVINGSYIGQPRTEHNGAGRFAVSLLVALSHRWEEYTTLTAEIEPDGMDYFLNIYLPMLEGNPVIGAKQ